MFAIGAGEPAFLCIICQKGNIGLNAVQTTIYLSLRRSKGEKAYAYRKKKESTLHALKVQDFGQFTSALCTKSLTVGSGIQSPSYLYPFFFSPNVLNQFQMGSPFHFFMSFRPLLSFGKPSLVLWLGLLWLLPFQLAAYTWNEPWFEQYFPKVTHVLQVKILDNSSFEFADVEVVATLAGKPVSGKFRIQGFFNLNTCIDQGEPIPGIWLQKMDTCYLFVRQGKGRSFQLPTPTSGMVPLSSGWVNCSLRHSYHQTIIQKVFFEKAIRATYAAFRGQPLADSTLFTEISAWLGKAPASPFGETETDFYHQQVALELVYHLKLKELISLVMPFAQHEQSLHQLSAFRAFRAAPSEDMTRFVFDEVRNPNLHKMVRSVALETLLQSSFKPDRMSLEQFYAETQDEYIGFGGDIRDPRTCTQLSGVRTLTASLLRQLAP